MMQYTKTLYIPSSNIIIKDSLRHVHVLCRHVHVCVERRHVHVHVLGRHACSRYGIVDPSKTPDAI